MKRWDIVEITWLDSALDSGWRFDHERVKMGDKGILTHYTVGYLYHRNKICTSVVQSQRPTLTEPKEAVTDALMEIPNCSILKIERIKRGNAAAQTKTK